MVEYGCAAVRAARLASCCAAIALDYRSVRRQISLAGPTDVQADDERMHLELQMEAGRAERERHEAVARGSGVAEAEKHAAATREACEPSPHGVPCRCPL